MEKEKRKELARSYKEQKVRGGVYSLTNRETGERHILGSQNLVGAENLFRFMVKTGSCSVLELQEEWDRYGPGAFAFEILATLEKKEEQTPKQFKKDIAALTALWKEEKEEKKEKEEGR